jgi:hypothetical protein
MITAQQKRECGASDAGYLLIISVIIGSGLKNAHRYRSNFEKKY